jgi:quercetin dioxygenase-like cupin family protein
MVTKENQYAPVRRFDRETGAFRWPAVPLKKYPASGTISQNVTKQVLFDPEERLPAELRYFEVEPGGYSALERHDHVHAVLILRGRGSVLVGETVNGIQEHDLVYTPPQTWHQFYAAEDSHLGFLCLVHGDRDRPSRPTDEEFAVLEAAPGLRGVVRR